MNCVIKEIIEIISSNQKVIMDKQILEKKSSLNKDFEWLCLV